MTASAGFICGRGGVSTSVYSASCDEPSGCKARVTAFGAEQRAQVVAIGWRRDPNTGLVYCPGHSGADLQLDDGMASAAP